MKLTQAIVHKLFKYDPQTGQLTWRRRPRSSFKSSARDQRPWNVKHAGKPALNEESEDGYRRGRLFRSKRKYRRVNIIWLWMTGSWPASIDRDGVQHLNGDRSDDRWCNLRDEDGEPARVDSTVTFLARRIGGGQNA